MPLAELVRFGLAGVLARINSVSHVFLHDDRHGFNAKNGELKDVKKQFIFNKNLGLLRF
jgi:hypothetical protein